MRPTWFCCAIVLTQVFAATSAPAQADLAGLLPAYPGSQVSVLPSETGECLAVSSSDNAKAVMIFFRKQLTYEGWQVLEGRVLEGDRTVVFTRNTERLTMTDDTPDGSATRILFSYFQDR